jgi:hypothetical protein
MRNLNSGGGFNLHLMHMYIFTYADHGLGLVRVAVLRGLSVLYTQNVRTPSR